MGVRADQDLQHSLTKIIDELDRAADIGASLSPTTIRLVSHALTIVRDCHQTLLEFEELTGLACELSKVVPIHSVKAGRAS